MATCVRDELQKIKKEHQHEKFCQWTPYPNRMCGTTCGDITNIGIDYNKRCIDGRTSIIKTCPFCKREIKFNMKEMDSHFNELISLENYIGLVRGSL